MSTISATTQSQIDPLTGLVGASATTGTSSTSTSSTAALSGTSSLANESTFLTLLVAQLKNQDPAQPADGTTFVTQLAQFTTLEQNLAMRTDLDSINTKTPAATASTTAAAASTGSSTTGQTSVTGA